MRRKVQRIKLRGDNQSICVRHVDSGKISRKKRYAAYDLVDSGKYEYASNSEWRAQKNGEVTKTEPEQVDAAESD